MSDLISRQAAIDEFYMATCDVDKVEWAETVLKRVPSAERKGHWIGYAGAIGNKCSECGKWLDVSHGNAEMNYCPNCGARMESEE